VAREIDFGKELDKIVKGDYGSKFGEASEDKWNVSFDKAEMEAYDEI
jgi:hypothetical protein